MTERVRLTREDAEPRKRERVRLNERGSTKRGKRENPGGRPPGARNKRTLASIAAAEAETGILPHQLLLVWAQTGKMDGKALSTEDRMSAARSAAPYYAAKLASITLKDNRAPVQLVVDPEKLLKMKPSQLAQLENLFAIASGEVPMSGGGEDLTKMIAASDKARDVTPQSKNLYAESLDG